MIHPYHQKIKLIDQLRDRKIIQAVLDQDTLVLLVEPANAYAPVDAVDYFVLRADINGSEEGILVLDTTPSLLMDVLGYQGVDLGLYSRADYEQAHEEQNRLMDAAFRQRELESYQRLKAIYEPAPLVLDAFTFQWKDTGQSAAGTAAALTRAQKLDV